MRPPVFTGNLFYESVLRRLLHRGILQPTHSVLVTCGGELDRQVFQRLGFPHVTISNLEAGAVPPAGEQCAPSVQDAEQLGFPDEHFDFCVVHAGLHHCRSPHRALLEMYRVARIGVVLIEPCDSPLTRLGVRLGLGQEYEHAAVFANALQAGGVRNTAVPNYVYRWTRREIIKCICAFAPWAPHRFLFFRAVRSPRQQWSARRPPLLRILTALLWPGVEFLGRLLPVAGNTLAAVVLKPDAAALHPWLERDANGGIRPARSWFARRFRARGTADGHP